jgi:beta-phosphoglucomutase-like phosphatase (HAD superfamily)
MVFEDTYSGVKAGKAAGMKVAVITTSHASTEWQGHDVDLILNNYYEADIRTLTRLFT